MKNVDMLVESPSHPVYQFADDVDATISDLKKIDPEERSIQEKQFIRFIKGRLYKEDKNRTTVIDAVVPGKHAISIFNKHVDLDDWGEWFERVTQNTLNKSFNKREDTFLHKETFF